MPDEHDTDPEIDVPEEPPTRPDLRFVNCPKCKGQGKMLRTVEETATTHRRVLGPCDLCNGSKRVDHATLAHHHAERQGRPSK
jgi:DnaJ-class molecular chaperone